MIKKKTQQNKKPKISVLMPAYNSDKYIGAAIESILNQTFSDFELVIINDGSTDNTAKIIKEYADKDDRIKFIDNKKNQGVARTRNQLLDVASGEYIAYQDSDDIALPDRLKIQKDFLDNNLDVSVLGAAMETFPEREFVFYPKSPKILDFYEANLVSNAVVMFRKQDIDKYGFRYKEEFKTCEDYDFWVRVVQVLKVYNLSDVLLKYRVLSHSLSHNNPDLDKFDKIIRDDLIDKLTSDEIIKMKLSPKYTILLFGFIPLFRVKRKRIYLLCFIPFLKLRGTWWYLFDIIPFFHNVRNDK